MTMQKSTVIPDFKPIANRDVAAAICVARPGKRHEPLVHHPVPPSPTGRFVNPAVDMGRIDD